MFILTALFVLPPSNLPISSDFGVVMFATSSIVSLDAVVVWLSFTKNVFLMMIFDHSVVVVGVVVVVVVVEVVVVFAG